VHRRATVILAATLAVLGFLLVASRDSTRDAERAQAPRRAELIELIETRRSQVDDLDDTVRELRAEVTAAEGRVARLSQLDEAQANRLTALATQAGTTALKGAGVEVRLSDSDQQPASPGDEGAYRIHDSDLQLVVNALFDAGAEAIAINDSRMVATTPIRAAGDTIVVNFRPLNPPYRVVAIGADREEFSDSAVAMRFRRWTRIFGLGFSVRQTSNLTVPAYTGRVAITTAQPQHPTTQAAGEGR
jgi:uncharacterized protein YlxW (UPF0749 family)